MEPEFRLLNDKILTVVIADTSPIWNEDQPANLRTVHIELTDEQVQQLKLYHIGSQGPNDFYESVSRVFFETRHPRKTNRTKIEKIKESIQYLQSCVTQAQRMLDTIPEENVIDKMSLNASIESNTLDIRRLQAELEKLLKEEQNGQ